MHSLAHSLHLPYSLIRRREDQLEMSERCQNGQIRPVFKRDRRREEERGMLIVTDETEKRRIKEGEKSKRKDVM